MKTDDMSPIANEGAIVRGEKYRFTVLTSQMIRLEYSDDGIFEDRASQCVMNRKFPVPDFEVQEKDDILVIRTKNLCLSYQKQKFTKNSLNIRVLGNVSEYLSVWHYGEKIENLFGTARTLDQVNGSCELESGLMSKGGYTILDDSHSLLMSEDGWIQQRNNECIDIYFLGYGRDYKQCLKDFYQLSGMPPLLPKYAFGNWWSRYYKYNEEQYKQLVERFDKENLPFSVAVLDMDWHLVDIDPEFGSGWTGYTWNKELFPNPPEFMEWLHKKGLKVTLNLHPADGVRPHEEMYADMAEALGMDPDKKLPIEFDVTDPEFMKLYFKILHHPHEKNGVDFWWIDWQSGDISKTPGLDPLWMLNHYHFLDNERNGKRGLIFSRYAGPGSHRYPIGFSGDSVITWDSLDFQPYFTVNATNIGYVYWSHDIGGHMMGYKDDELMTRWVQFGVFSPINRLHSSSSPFNGKEPWRYTEPSATVIKKFLRLRHRMIPYLYSMNYLCHREGEPLLKPIYYEYPWEEKAYQEKNQYYFGTQLLVCPITTQAGHETLCAKTKGFLPPGIWFDIFNGRVYKGGRKINFYRTLEEMPVFAKAGAIIPLYSGEHGNKTDNAENLEVMVFPGADGEFDLYEDDGVGISDNKFAVTRFRLDWKGKRFVVEKPEGYLKALPETRAYRIIFKNWQYKSKPDILINGERGLGVLQTDNQELILELPMNPTETEYEIRFSCDTEIKLPSYKEQVFEFLNRAQIEFMYKDEIYSLISKKGNITELIQELQAMNISPDVLEALSEILWAYV